jgi:DNA recombination protein RmuC
MDYLVPALLVCASVLGAAWWMHRSLVRREDSDTLGMLQNQMNAVALQTGQQMEQLRTALRDINTQVTQSLDNTRQTVDTRLDSAAKVIQGVHRQLGELGESTKHIFAVGKDIASLQETLRSPKLRGNLGELFLSDLLAQILPPGHYRTQHTFRGGETVDAVIVLQAGMVPVDAKFPLENFKRVVDADDETARAAARKAFMKDVKVHVDAIASKYIRTDENTFDFALMYIPAENVYYETIIKEDDAKGDLALFSYALSKRVIPVSPNSLYAYLQTILLGLKGMRVEESAREIINNLARLQKEFERFSEAFRLTGRHLENAQKQYTESAGRLVKVEAKMEQIDGDVKGIGEQGPPSLPPAGD